MKMLLEKMKYVLMFSLAILILTQCGGDDEGDNKTAHDDLIGTWTASSATFEFDLGGQTLTQFFQDALGLSEADAQAITDAFESDFEEGFTGNVQFNDDNTYESSFGGDIETGTYVFFEGPDSMSLTLDPNDGDEMKFDIVTLNSNTLVISITETENEDFDGDGTNEILTTTIELAFDKAS